MKQGWREYQLGEFKKAIESFDSVLAQTDAQNPLHIDALYGIATTWNLRRPDEKPEIARSYYEKLLEVAPDSDLAAWTLLGLARMEHLVPVGQTPDYDAVRRKYREVIERFPDHLAGHEAFIYLQAIDVAAMNPKNARKALEALDGFLKKNPDSGFVSACYSLKSICYEVLQDPDKQLEMELLAFENSEVDPTNPFQDNTWSYWRIATLAEFEVGDFATARKYYGLLIEEYPTDQKVYTAKVALQRMDDMEAKIRAEMN